MSSRLQVLSPIGITASQACLTAASIADHAPVLNIVPFGSCALLGGNPCVPVTLSPWIGGIVGAPYAAISPVLTDAHVLVCGVGGLISIADPGQQTVEVGDIVEPELEEGDDEPGFFEVLWDDGGLLLDVAAVAFDVVTIPSGESVAMIGARRALRAGLKRGLRARAKPKPGSAGGPGSGKRFSEKVKDQAERQAGGRCVFCGIKTTRGPGPTQRHIDHAIARSRGGNNTIENAQNTCRTCNLRKGDKSTEEFLRP